GLNPRALRRLGRKATPHLHRFVSRGASTLNARTSRESTATLPNHTGMVTGRRVDAAHGGHGVDWNDERTSPATVQEAAGHPVSSVFAEVDAAGGSTALFAGKEKFRLWARSWPDAIDRTTVRSDNDRLVRAFVNDLGTDRALRFLHLSAPDLAGHHDGFMTASYLRAVRRTDARIGRVVRALKEQRDVWSSTTVLLTSDHGGAREQHYRAGDLQNYRVMFAARGPAVAAGKDLYDLNPQRRDPGRSRTTYDAERQPVRNGDVANLALSLLGLGPVPDSAFGFSQDLVVTAP
ncbi:MAG: alkaline phosphatase family protein, partial [Nocardioides sp.]|uniref:alkaline phosphatase family protein n=1 Tax=Nocardioides sp. TaxID=35761 RepID=UPI003F073D06